MSQSSTLLISTPNLFDDDSDNGYRKFSDILSRSESGYKPKFAAPRQFVRSTSDSRHWRREAAAPGCETRRPRAAQRACSWSLAYRCRVRGISSRPSGITPIGGHLSVTQLLDGATAHWTANRFPASYAGPSGHCYATQVTYED